MEEIKALLVEILSNQVAIYKRLESVEKAVKGGARFATDATYVEELKKEAEKYRTFIDRQTHS